MAELMHGRPVRNELRKAKFGINVKLDTFGLGFSNGVGPGYRAGTADVSINIDPGLLERKFTTEKTGGAGGMAEPGPNFHLFQLAESRLPDY